MSKPSNIVNAGEVAVTELARGRFRYRRKMLSESSPAFTERHPASITTTANQPHSRRRVRDASGICAGAQGEIPRDAGGRDSTRTTRSLPYMCARNDNSVFCSSFRAWVRDESCLVGIALRGSRREESRRSSKQLIGSTGDL